MKNPLLYFILTAIVVGGIGVWVVYKYLIDAPAVPNDIKDPYVYIPTGSSFQDVVDSLNLKGWIANESAFRRLAAYMKYEKNPMRAGRYQVEPGMSAIALIRHLRGGGQAPVNVVIHNERLPEEIAKKIAGFLEPNTQDFLALFNDENYLNELGYDKATLTCLFIPNTYQLYWNSTPKGFMDRMVRENEGFWSQAQRLAKAQQLGLTTNEVYTLASIVEKETLVNSEKPRIAGVYLNRLAKNIKLQADPTAVFATKDFDVGRVLYKHINFDSPYNTYMYAGLPPGPITVTSISSIDAVLNAEKHDYIYFCAKGDGSGLHAFAKGLNGHHQNVANYKKNLRKRGIR